MAFTRKMLKALGIEDDKIDQIIEAHTEVTDALKAERDQLKAEAEKLTVVQGELESLKSKEGDDWKGKYEAVKKQFDDFKADQSAKETNARKQAAYRAMLGGLGISEKRQEAILRVTDLTGVNLTADGKLEDEKKLEASAKADWAEFVTTRAEQGANTATPPANNGTGMTKTQILAIKDTAQRQQAIADNHELFGF